MADDFSALENMEYSGRSFIAFRTMKGDVGFTYELTGRSPPFQARRFVCDEKSGVIRTELVTESEALKRMFNVSDEQIPELLAKIESGNQALTIYPAMRWVVVGDKPRLIVSNGAQTKLLYNAVVNSSKKNRPESILEKALKDHFFEYDEKAKQDIDLVSYEPDKPIYTSRINGCMDMKDFAYHVITRDTRPPITITQHCFDEFELEPGKGILIATYKGGNEKPHPLSFEHPFEVKIIHTSAEDICRRVYDIITKPNPNDGNKVYGVAAAVMMMKPNLKLEHALVNRADVVMGE